MFVEAALLASYATTPRAPRQHLFALLWSRGAPRSLLQIHAQVVVNSCAGSSFVLAQLLSRYVGSGLLTGASRAFDGAWNPSTPGWNQMIRGHVIRGHGRGPAPRESVECFAQMVRRGAELDGYTFSHLLSACVRLGLFGERLQEHRRVVRVGTFAICL